MVENQGLTDKKYSLNISGLHYIKLEGETSQNNMGGRRSRDVKTDPVIYHDGGRPWAGREFVLAIRQGQPVLIEDGKPEPVDYNWTSAFVDLTIGATEIKWVFFNRGAFLINEKWVSADKLKGARVKIGMVNPRLKQSLY